MPKKSVPIPTPIQSRGRKLRAAYTVKIRRKFSHRQGRLISEGLPGMDSPTSNVPEAAMHSKAATRQRENR